jgi:hypothetical protein
MSPLRIAAKKHHTDVSALLSTTTVATNEPTSVTPMVRASGVVDTKNGPTTGTT